MLMVNDGRNYTGSKTQFDDRYHKKYIYSASYFDYLNIKNGVKLDIFSRKGNFNFKKINNVKLSKQFAMSNLTLF